MRGEFTMPKLFVKAIVLGLLAMAALPATAQAAGFAVGEQGAAAMGVGGAATARPDLGEVGFYNPAGWGFAEGLQVTIGASALRPNINHIDPQTGNQTQADRSLGTPPYLHAGARFGDFAAGLSFGVPFGGGVSWPDDWQGRFESTLLSLTVFEVGATLAWRPIDELSIAAGPRLQRASVAYNRRIDFVDTEGSVELMGNSNGVGGQVALMYRPTERLTLGLNWRSRVTHDFDGYAYFNDVPVEMSHRAHDQPVSTQLTLPDRLAFGAAWEFAEAIASVDVTWWAWSTFEEFAIDFDSDQTPDVAQPRNWSDTFTIRAGFEQRGVIDDVIRLGLAFDPTPSPSNTLSPASPDANRLIPSIGFGYYFLEDFTVDLAYAHTFMFGSESSGQAYPGRYDSGIDVVSLGLRYAPGR
jgi:long-chain fatty acid transport protein